MARSDEEEAEALRRMWLLLEAAEPDPVVREMAIEEAKRAWENAFDSLAGKALVERVRTQLLETGDVSARLIDEARRLTSQPD